MDAVRNVWRKWIINRAGVDATLIQLVKGTQSTVKQKLKHIL